MIESATPRHALRIGYEWTSAQACLASSDVLAVFGFGASTPLPDDPRVFRVGLEPLRPAPLEVWRVEGPVRCGRDDALRWSADGRFLFFALEVDEARAGGIVAATEQAYASIARFVPSSATPHLLRLWNYFDAINDGDGDDERYRLFCEGRARGMRAIASAQLPAATAIGRQDGVRVLQVYGLAASEPGTPVENPRQVSAWRYPRQYGPTPPRFARGMRVDGSQLLISGTAAVVGHASCHSDDFTAQVDETCRNLASLVVQADIGASTVTGRDSLKVYLRHPDDIDALLRLLSERIQTVDRMVVLASDICRRELLVEIDGVQCTIV